MEKVKEAKRFCLKKLQHLPGAYLAQHFSFFYVRQYEKIEHFPRAAFWSHGMIPPLSFHSLSHSGVISTPRIDHCTVHEKLLGYAGAFIILVTILAQTKWPTRMIQAEMETSIYDCIHGDNFGSKPGLSQASSKATLLFPSKKDKYQSYPKTFQSFLQHFDQTVAL